LTDILDRLASERRAGRILGVTSVCSAHPLVLRAALDRGRRTKTPVLIEATCNQVNQDGGYTGMTPADFRRFVQGIAAEMGFDAGGLILGGDHLGPNPWRALDSETALGKAEAMVAAYAAAGYSKLHLDASMGCAGEPEAVDDELAASRAARLALVAERSARDAGLPPPRYVVGTEVPPPGGARHGLEAIEPTSPRTALHTIKTHQAIFAAAGLVDAFRRVVALVVQPGVEFGHDAVAVYKPERAKTLSSVLDREHGLVFEAHSTDYQPPEALKRLVEDGFPILKVGPGLTFALREALYGLDLIASELDPDYPDRALRHGMEALMLAEPRFWTPYYSDGSDGERRILRHYSYSDRIRYYWAHPDARAAVDRLLQALAGRAIPATLVSQFLPQLVGPDSSVPEGSSPQALLLAAVDRVLAVYAEACAARS
jgi:D-tagatose-bisphosphate aldolase class II non-catalytic subunit